MSDKKNPPIPPAAQAAGMTDLVFDEEFDSYDGIDVETTGNPGFNFYTDRPFWYHNKPLKKDLDYTVSDSVLHFAPRECQCSLGLQTHSVKGDTGFLMHYGYAEARLRFQTHDVVTHDEGREGWPAFWCMAEDNIMSRDWQESGELDIFEGFLRNGKDGNSGVIHAGSIHSKRFIRNSEGKRAQQFCSNNLTATGYHDDFIFLDDEWHTYAMLWEKGHVAWYLDNVLLHSARFWPGKTPEYYYQDSESPIPEHFQEGEVHCDWPGAHTVLEGERHVVFLGADKRWPMDVDWVRIWNKD